MDHQTLPELDPSIDSSLKDFFEATQSMVQKAQDQRNDLLVKFALSFMVNAVAFVGLSLANFFGFKGFGAVEFGTMPFASMLYYVSIVLLGMVVFFGFLMWVACIGSSNTFRTKEFRVLGDELSAVLKTLQSAYCGSGRSLTKDLDHWRAVQLRKGFPESAAATLIQKFYTTGDFERRQVSEISSNDYIAKGAKERLGAHATEIFLSFGSRIFIGFISILIFVIACFVYQWLR